MISREEVVWIYRVLLCRDPESEHLIDCYQKDFATLSEMRAHILRSEEFRQRENVTFRPRPNVANGTRESIVGALRANIVNNVGFQKGTAHAELTGDLQKVLRRIKEVKKMEIILILGESPAAQALIQYLSTLDDLPIAILQLLPSSSNIGSIKIDTRREINASLVAQMQVSLEVFSSIVFEIPASIDLLYIVDTRSALEGLARFYGRIAETGACVIEKEGMVVGAMIDPLRSFMAAFARDLVEHATFLVLPKSYWYSGHVGTGTIKRDEVATNVRPRIALASILKNEAASVCTMLASIEKVVDFISLVDTGSNDGTVEIIRRWLERSGIRHSVKSVEFIDFSQARNTALLEVPSSMEWILMLDGDEFLDVGGAAKLVELTRSNEEGWALPRYNYVDVSRSAVHPVYPDRQRRLFRNKSEDPYLFTGAVHETLRGVAKWALAPPDLSALGGEPGGPHIHHMGQAISYERWLEKDRFYKSLGAP